MVQADGLPTYVLRGGVSAAERLAMLDELCWPTTESFLRLAGVDEGHSLLDVGCGTGLAARRIAQLVGDSGRVRGVDADAAVIDLARAATHAAEANVTFAVGDATTYRDDHRYDVVFARFLLSHCADPSAVLETMVRHARAGGTVVVEDVHIPGHFSVPPSAAFDRFVELYQAAARARGGDPLLGARLPELLRRAGVTPIEFRAEVPTFDTEPGLGFAAVTLEATRDAIVSSGLASDDEVQSLVAELQAFAGRPGTVMSITRVCQAFGTLTE